MSWEEWLQDVGKDAIGKYVDKETTPTQAQMQLGALGQNGYYREGMPGYMATPNSVNQVAGMSSNTMMLFGGVALLAVVFMVLKD
jgi:hypothetical protein